jgi:ribosome-binding protein aMBF1 (putative translation factor)
MPRKFSELRDKMPPESRKRADELAKQMLAEYKALEEVRAARALTQQRLAQILGKDQSVISRLERRTDMYISTLAEFIEGMGGKLEIRAIFPDSEVVITQFQNAGSRVL